MSMSDPIADMLTRVRNAIMGRHDEVKMPYSRIKQAIAETLQSEGYVIGYEKIDEGVQGTLVIKLKYQRNQSVISGLKRVSKPSRRIYVPFDGIPLVKSGLGISILSTNRGVMSDRFARKERVGGEVLCEVW